MAGTRGGFHVNNLPRRGDEFGWIHRGAERRSGLENPYIHKKTGIVRLTYAVK